MATPSPLLRNLLLFSRLLRALGLRITSAQLVDLASSLGLIDIGSREDFRLAARCILVSKRADIEPFDRAFELFWRFWSQPGHNMQLESLIAKIHRGPKRGKAGTPRPHERDEGETEGVALLQAVAAQSGDVESEDREDQSEAVIALYSPGEALRNKDFALYSADELRDARRFLSTMRWDLTRRRSRRVRPSRRGRRLDLRRSLRGSIGHGGEMLHLAYRGPKMKRRSLVVLCDISGSMDRYTRLLLHFLHSLEHSVSGAEVFVFGTRLTRITPALRRQDPDRAVAAVAVEVQDWSGGTRIGEVLRSFNRQWARRVLGRGAIVLIISDGWDRGDPEALAAEMERLQRASYRLLWLNPLLGAENYEPLTQGIKAALPYVDDFLPVHNLASLQALATLLNAVQEGRPVRGNAVRKPTSSVDSALQ